MTRKFYQEPALQEWADLIPETLLCSSTWTDGSIGDDLDDWNHWGEI